MEIPPGFSMLSSVFCTGDNGMDSVLYALRGYGQDLNGITVFKMESTGYRANNYLNGWCDSNMVLRPGEGWFFKNPRSSSIPMQFHGLAFFGTNRLPAGFSVCSSIAPQQGRLSTDLLFPAENGDKVFVFNPVIATYSVHTYSGSWTPSEPVIPIGQSFWVKKGAAADWVWFFDEIPGANILMDHEYPLASTLGQLNFFTFNQDSRFGRVFEADGLTPLSTNYVGQLYAGRDLDEGGFQPLGTPANFEPGSGAGYLRANAVFVPFASGGQRVYAQVRAWRQTDGATFEAAFARRGLTGKSAVIALTAHSVIENELPGLPPPDVNEFPSFPLTRPPQSITSLQVTERGVLLGCEGAAGETYLIQAAPNLNPTGWKVVGTAGAGTNGIFQFLDITATNYSTRFYRTSRP